MKPHGDKTGYLTEEQGDLWDVADSVEGQTFSTDLRRRVRLHSRPAP